MKTYDSFTIRTSGLFAKFNHPGDPVFAFDADESTLTICNAMRQMFGRCKDNDDESVVSLSTVEMKDGTILDALFISEGTPGWVRSIIDDYVAVMIAFCNEKRLFIGAAEFPTWYGDKPAIGDFSDDLFFVMAKKSVFGDSITAFENAPHGWKLPSVIPIFLIVQEVTTEQMVLSPLPRLRRMLPFQFAHPKKEMYEMCIGNELLINAAPTSASSRLITDFNQIQ